MQVGWKRSRRRQKATHMQHIAKAINGDALMGRSVCVMPQVIELHGIMSQKPPPVSQLLNEMESTRREYV